MTLTRFEAAERLSHSTQFVAAAVRLGFIKAKKLRPLILDSDDVDALFLRLDRELILHINTVIKAPKAISKKRR